MALWFKDRVKFRVRIRVWAWSGVTLLALWPVCFAVTHSYWFRYGINK